MRLRIHQLTVRLGFGEGELAKAVCRRLKCAREQIGEIELVRRSLDARRKDRPPQGVVTVEVEYRGRPPRVEPGRVERAPRPEPAVMLPPWRGAGPPPVVVGAGPAGLLAALTLAEAGCKPLLVERGAEAADRARDVEAFWRNGTLDPESNVLYGEGGAGLFSDGKLTARSKDRAGIRRFFEILVEAGASSDILVEAMPHIGSDDLQRIMPAVRNRIWALGGACVFNARLERLIVEAGALRGVVVAGREIRTDACFLATGHSARDIYRMLADAQVAMEAKPFAVGVRLEIPQARIDAAQYGRWAQLPQIGPASFRLTRQEEDAARRCYSFCMCPGGEVISCASTPGLLTTNGMSLSARDKPFGNAAFLVPVEPADFVGEPGHPALAGIAFQERMERAAFAAGGGDYGVPAARLEDFLAGCAGALPAERSCARAVPAVLQDLLPGFVAETLASAIPRMLGELDGVVPAEALLYAAETRSSAPLRVLRGPDGASLSLQGLYPCGEGAGFAGGIVSSALDGMRAAERFVQAQASSRVSGFDEGGSNRQVRT